MANALLTLDLEIISDPSVRHREPVVGGTATTVRAIAELWSQGMAPEEIPLHLPHLHVRQVFAALYYYLGHRQEIDAFIVANHIPESLSGRRFDPGTQQVQ